MTIGATTTINKHLREQRAQTKVLSQLFHNKYLLSKSNLVHRASILLDVPNIRLHVLSGKKIGFKKSIGNEDNPNKIY
jgi:hypothetical protein